jgi:hypothetical protein
VPRGTVPTVGELEARIDEAVVIARASEEGVREVGEIALDAARQARRAAEAAEASAAAAVEAVQIRPESSEPVGPVTDLVPPPAAGAAGAASSGWSPKSAPPAGREAQEGSTPPPQPRFEVRFRSFNERADRVAARLRALEEHPRHPGGPNVGAARRRGDG